MSRSNMDKKNDPIVEIPAKELITAINECKSQISLISEISTTILQLKQKLQSKNMALKRTRKRCSRLFRSLKFYINSKRHFAALKKIRNCMQFQTIQVKSMAKISKRQNSNIQKLEQANTRLNDSICMSKMDSLSALTV